MANIVFIALSIFLFWGCAPKYEQKPHISKANFQKADWEELQGFETDNLDTAFEVFQSNRNPYCCTGNNYW